MCERKAIKPIIPLDEETMEKLDYLDWEQIVPLTIMPRMKGHEFDDLSEGTLVYDYYHLEKKDCTLIWMGCSTSDDDIAFKEADCMTCGRIDIDPPSGMMTMRDFWRLSSQVMLNATSPQLKDKDMAE